MMAGVLGFEPRMTESESVALPLGDTPTGSAFISKSNLGVKDFPEIDAGNFIHKYANLLLKFQ